MDTEFDRANGPTRPKDPTSARLRATDMGGRVGPTLAMFPGNRETIYRAGKWGLLRDEVVFKAGDAGKLAGIEAGATYQNTVNIALSHDGSHVVGLD